MLNQGAGTFDSPGTIFRLEQYVRSLSLADLNEDGKLDLVFGYGSSYGNGVSVLFDRSHGASTACQVSLVDTRVTGRRVALSWSVRGVTGLNAIVCRQAAGEAWRDVAEVTSDAANLVRFEDASLEPGHYRYRLRFRSAGQETYAGDVEVWVPDVAFALSGVTPNPSDGRLVAMFSLPSAATANFELVDISGRRVWSRRLDHPTPGTQRLDLARGERLPSGMYWLRLSQAGRSATAKAVVLR
jgi:hypothetical protein